MEEREALAWIIVAIYSVALLLSIYQVACRHWLGRHRLQRRTEARLEEFKQMTAQWEREDGEEEAMCREADRITQELLTNGASSSEATTGTPSERRP